MLVQWSARALADLQQIRGYWAPRDPSLAIQLEEQISSALRFIAEHPKAGNPVGGSSRRRKCRIGKTRLLLLYRIGDEWLTIAGVRHMAQNWREPH